MTERSIQLPPPVAALLARLSAAGFAAYAVGGCVRDSLLGEQPKDWDVCTEATPEQICACFERTVCTGLRYGTVTVLWQEGAYEVTTFRTEAAYSDGRHPDDVRFVRSLREDLSRRDFTINAMAAGGDGRVIDPFGGAEDLRRGVLRCVGCAEARFSEDALRIVRALRFSARFGFPLEAQTAAAVHAQKERLRAVAVERIGKELRGILEGGEAARVLAEFSDVLFTILPELRPMEGFCQYNHHHAYDVWRHTLAVVAAAPPELRLAALLHDCGKPTAFSFDKQLVGHFYDHAVIGAAMTEDILRRLRFDSKTVRFTSELVRLHDCDLPTTQRGVRRALSRWSAPMLRALTLLRFADRLGTGGQQPDAARRDQLLSWIETTQCLTLRDLAIHGDDLLALGFPAGPALGALLKALLDAVLSQSVPNERQALIAYAQNVRDSGKGMIDNLTKEG